MSEPITSIDLSNKGLTELPKEILDYKETLEILDISNHNFTDLNSVAEILSQFEKLTNLNIDLENEEDASLILQSLKYLKVLNGQATDEEEEENNNNENNNNENNINENNNNENNINENNINEENDEPLRQSELNQNAQSDNENENKNNENQIEIPEVQDASLQSEINNFNEIVSNIKKYYENQPDEVNKFSDYFQDI